MIAALSIALWLRALGLSVIPVPRPRPGVPTGEPGDGKVPIISWGEFQDRLPTEQELHTWFGAEPMNLAVVTGAVSNVVVIDADSEPALRWATAHFNYTPWQTKTRKGFHLWYRHPGVQVRNRVRVETRDGRVAMDVRGDGGYVIAPGSLHASGIYYTFAGDWTREDVPRFWPGWLQRPTRPPIMRPPAPWPTGDVVERARKYLAAIPPPTIGAGSDVQTFSVACKLARGFDLSAQDVEALLWQWAGDRPDWTPDWIAEKVAHAMRYGSEPIGGLR